MDGPLLQKCKLEIFLNLGIFRQGIYKESPLLISDDERIEINMEKRATLIFGYHTIILIYTQMCVHFSIQISTTRKAELLLAAADDEI